MKKLRIGSLIGLVGWIIFAQSCMFFRTSDTKAAEEFNAKVIAAEVHYKNINGIKMHYVQTGSNNMPTIFFIHGSPGSWDAFKSYLQDKELLEKFRLISVDRPGFGYSDFGRALNLQDQSIVVGKILEQLYNGRDIYLVGHSLGGPLAVRLAIDHPGKFSGLVLLSAAMDPALEKTEGWRKVFMNNPLQYLVPGAFRPSNYELWYLKNDLQILKKDMQHASLPFIWMVHGDKDGMVSYDNVDFIKKQVDNRKLKIITLEGANHFIPWTYYNHIKNVLMDLPVISESSAQSTITRR